MSERVNVCVIVGNGFDMAAGLGTSTETFVSRFAEQHAGADSPAGRLAARIVHDGPKTWADFERKLGEYAADAEGFVGDGSAADEYISAKTAIEGDLGAFIQSREALADLDKVKGAAEGCLSSICDWIGALTPRDRKRFLGEFSSPYTFNVRFVSLNYTRVLDEMIDHQGPGFKAYSADYIDGYSLFEIVHAHGGLWGNPICGVDNPSQICSERLAEDDAVLETVVKGKSQWVLGSLDDENALDLLRSAEVVMVYGCSMGVTDARWWKAVIGQLKSSSTKRFIVLFSHGFERAGRPVAEVRERMNGLKEDLFAAAGMGDDEDKSELFSRIFILPSGAIFKMPETLVADPAE